MFILSLRRNADNFRVVTASLYIEMIGLVTKLTNLSQYEYLKMNVSKTVLNQCTLTVQCFCQMCITGSAGISLLLYFKIMFISPLKSNAQNF